MILPSWPQCTRMLVSCRCLLHAPWVQCQHLSSEQNTYCMSVCLCVPGHVRSCHVMLRFVLLYHVSVCVCLCCICKKHRDSIPRAQRVPKGPFLRLVCPFWLTLQILKVQCYEYPLGMQLASFRLDQPWEQRDVQRCRVSNNCNKLECIDPAILLWHILLMQVAFG